MDVDITQRSRYEKLLDQFRPTLAADDQVLALQTRVVVRAGGERLSFLGEIMDSRAEWNDADSLVNGTVVNTLEPIQLYAAWQARGSLGTSAVRVGRMTLDVGKRRLLARNRFRNTVNNFTGADWHWQAADGREARAFYFLPMRALPVATEALLDNDQRLDRTQRGAALWGAYYAFAPRADQTTLELFALRYRVRGAADETLDLPTAGARVYRPAAPARWSYEVEAILQGGESSAIVAGTARRGLSHRAHFLHLQAGYQLDTPWSPHIALQYDLATGDEDPSDGTVERFNTLFGARRFDFNPTGIYGPFARSNIDTPGIRVEFQPTARFEAMLSYRSFRLAEPRDGWVGVGLRDSTGAAGDSLGRQLEGTFTWDAIPQRLTLETGFALLAAGSFPERVAGAAFRGDSSYFYAALTTTF